MSEIKIFLLNGPPGSGKDTAAEHLEKSYQNAKLVKFATPLKLAAAAIYFGGDMEEFKKHDTYEEKGKPKQVFFGKTCREVQIAISEEFLKIFHDEKIFGKILSNEILRLNEKEGINTFFVSDSGFREEAEVLVQIFGHRNVNLIRIKREGYTFEGDSRDYINLDDLGVNTFDVNNPTGMVKKFLNHVETYVAVR